MQNIVLINNSRTAWRIKNAILVSSVCFRTVVLFFKKVLIILKYHRHKPCSILVLGVVPLKLGFEKLWANRYIFLSKTDLIPMFEEWCKHQRSFILCAWTHHWLARHIRFCGVAKHYSIRGDKWKFCRTGRLVRSVLKDMWDLPCLLQLLSDF